MEPDLVLGPESDKPGACRSRSWMRVCLSSFMNVVRKEEGSALRPRERGPSLACRGAVRPASAVADASMNHALRFGALRSFILMNSHQVLCSDKKSHLFVSAVKKDREFTSQSYSEM